MEIDRRSLLLGSLTALTVKPRAASAAGGMAAAYVAAARMTDESFAVLLLGEDGAILRQVPLSARGHDIALHHESQRAVVFARRPGTFAVGFSTMLNAPPTIFEAVKGRHFYGHGAFSRDGRLLYVSENDIANGKGVIGIYDVEAAYRRLGEHESYGVGPHELVLLDDGRTLAVANGGLDTVPEAGRENLNLDDMNPNLSFVDSVSGELLARHELSPDLRRLSLRHLASDAWGRVWFGGQWEGDPSGAPELVGHASRDRPLQLLAPVSPLGTSLKGYIGSLAASRDRSIVAASAPKAGCILYIDAATGRLVSQSALKDGCGIAGDGGERTFAASSGLGVFRHETADANVLSSTELAGISFDNHLRRLF